jgi:hypothetical protein
MKMHELDEGIGQFRGISRDAYKRDEYSSQQGFGRPHRDWDEGNTEPPNNFAIYINGKKWKVFQGHGHHADDHRERQQYHRLQDMCAKKTAATGKKWTVHVTGEAPTDESVAEGGGQQAAIAIAKRESGKYTKDGKRIKESATAGATSSANIATVANPGQAYSKKPVKSVNALDQDEVSLFGAPMETTRNTAGKKAAIIKRR